jgi:superfamily II DNA/RNA helicase
MKFKEMSISGRTIDALEIMKYEDATEVQEKTIPLMLQGGDLMVRSQTGTGKTAAFGIGLIELLSKDRSKKGLILAPTRELASQICDELRSIAKNHRMSIFAVYGGQSMGRQISALRRGVDILVATPGRLLDHIGQGTVRMETINCVILDEADRMLDMGFKPDIDRILGRVSSQKQVLLFSATLDSNIQKIARDYMQAPQTIEIGNLGKVERIDEEFIKLNRAEKFDRLKGILLQDPDAKTLVFLRSKRSVEHTCRKLKKAAVEAQFLHGGKSQNQRERTVRGFQEGSFRILVATDVAARGLHIENVSQVINYDQADSDDTHTHRIGRTGRNGNAGKAITFVEVDPLPRKGGYGIAKRRGSYKPSRNRSSFAY